MKELKIDILWGHEEMMSYAIQNSKLKYIAY